MSQHTINLHPFTVPNFVRPIMPSTTRQQGFIEAPAIPLSDLSIETLDEMCREFRVAVFDKAGKVDSQGHSN